MKKKIIFTMVGSMLIGAGAVTAQQYDTAGRASNRQEQSQQRYEQQDQSRQDRRQSWQQQSDRYQDETTYSNEGMVIIDKDELPASMKKKLKKDKYAGWENSTIYHNTNTGEYVIAPRAYRFDKQGNEIEIDNLSYGSRDGQSRSQDDADRAQSGQDQSYQSQQNRSYDQSNQGQRNRSYDRSTQGQQNSDYDRATQGQQDRNYDQSSQGKQNNAYDQSSQGQQNRSYDQSSQRSQNGTYDQSTSDQSNTQNQNWDQSSANQQRSDDERASQSPGYDQASEKEQNDDAQSRESTSYRTNDSQSSGNQYQPGQSQTRYETEGMVEIQAEQIPASLRRTLSDVQYEGWEEKGTLYQDPTSSEYVLVMDKNDKTSQSQSQSYRSSDQSTPKTYRFDKNGQLKEDDMSSSQQK